MFYWLCNVGPQLAQRWQIFVKLKILYNFVDLVINWTIAVTTLILFNSVYLKLMLAVPNIGPTLFTQRQRYANDGPT